MLIAIIALSILVLLLIGGLIFACKQVEWEREFSADLSRQLDEANTNYQALDQGRDEESEAYQQELLDADDKIAMLALERDETVSCYNQLTDEVLFHRDRCLPVLGEPFEPDEDNEEPTPIFDELADLMYG